MWAVILLLCVLIFSVVALLIAYFDLRDTVKIMQSTIDMQNERYTKCLKGWDESIQSVLKVVNLNDSVIETNRELCDIVYDKLDDIHDRVDSMDKCFKKCHSCGWKEITIDELCERIEAKG